MRLFRSSYIYVLFKKYFDYYYLRCYGVETKLGYVNLIGLPKIEKHPTGIIRIGKNVTLISKNSGNIAGINHKVNLASLTENSELIIEGPFGASGSSIIARNKIIIGGGSGLGANSHIYDNDFHPIELNSSNIINSRPVILGKNVWVAADCLILKGVTINDNAVIGAGSVVSNIEIPEKTIYAGNPIKFIKLIE